MSAIGTGRAGREAVGGLSDQTRSAGGMATRIDASSERSFPALPYAAFFLTAVFFAVVFLADVFFAATFFIAFFGAAFFTAGFFTAFFAGAFFAIVDSPPIHFRI